MLRSMKIITTTTFVLFMTACTAPQTPVPTSNTYSLIGKITVQDGMRAEFTELLASVLDASNCISCTLIADKTDPNVLWVSETWPSEAAHDDALKTPEAQAALKLGQPMIVKMERMTDNG